MKWVIHDPLVRQREFPYTVSKDLEETLKDADIAVIFVKHKEYFDLKADWLKDKMKTPIIIDGRDVIKLEEFRKKGFAAYGVGKPSN